MASLYHVLYTPGIGLLYRDAARLLAEVPEDTVTRAIHIAHKLHPFQERPQQVFDYIFEAPETWPGYHEQPSGRLHELLMLDLLVAICAYEDQTEEETQDEGQCVTSAG